MTLELEKIRSSIFKKTCEITDLLSSLEIEEKVTCLNQIRLLLHNHSPFIDEPVDYVQWIKSEAILGNDYNPNKVAPPEMKLLEISIQADGYTQPIVTSDENDVIVVVDGFHRSKISKENKVINKKLYGYTPIVKIRTTQKNIEERMASTIRHNRARGKHGIDPMSDIVAYLAKKGWDDEKIAKELGMDADEVLRFKQITGLTELFLTEEFSEAWEPETT